MSGCRSTGPRSRVTRLSRTSGVSADEVEDRLGVLHRPRIGPARPFDGDQASMPAGRPSQPHRRPRRHRPPVPRPRRRRPSASPRARSPRAGTTRARASAATSARPPGPMPFGALAAGARSRRTPSPGPEPADRPFADRDLAGTAIDDIEAVADLSFADDRGRRPRRRARGGAPPATRSSAVGAGANIGSARSRSSSRTWTTAWASASTTRRQVARTMIGSQRPASDDRAARADERDQDRDGDRAEREHQVVEALERAEDTGEDRVRRHPLEQRPAGDVHELRPAPHADERGGARATGNGTRPTIASGAPQTTRPIANGPARRRRPTSEAADRRPDQAAQPDGRSEHADARVARRRADRARGRRRSRRARPRRVLPAPISDHDRSRPDVAPEQAQSVDQPASRARPGPGPPQRRRRHRPRRRVTGRLEPGRGRLACSLGPDGREPRTRPSPSRTAAQAEDRPRPGDREKRTGHGGATRIATFWTVDEATFAAVSSSGRSARATAGARSGPAASSRSRSSSAWRAP